MASDAGFLALAPEEYVRLDAFGPFEEPTDWHVNEKQIIASGTGRRVGFAFQRADTRAQWLVLAVEETDDGVAIDNVAIASTTNRRNIVDETPTILATADTEEDLDDG